MTGTLDVALGMGEGDRGTALGIWHRGWRRVRLEEGECEWFGLGLGFGEARCRSEEKKEDKDHDEKSRPTWGFWVYRQKVRDGNGMVWAATYYAVGRERKG